MFFLMGRPMAIANMSGGSAAPNLFGSVKFYPVTGGVLVVAEVSGLPQSETEIFGLHIHEGRSCAGEDFPATGSHDNPENKPHPRHAGDLPPLFSCAGKAFLAVKTNRFRVDQVIGKTVVIHSDPDDFTGQPAGNSGRKIACGEIETF